MRTRITHISFRAVVSLLLFFTLVINAPGLSAAPAGSTYPVQVNPMLIPPYSLYLSDYFSGTTERLSLTLTNRDLQQPQVRVKLRLTIACASGLTLTTHPQAIFDPIVLDAGVPTRLTMQELAPYFLPARLLTQGYMQGGKLSEGNVEFGFEVLEYNTGKVLSQKNIAFGNIISPKPPKLNLPINNDIVTVNEPQQLTFQWSPQYFSTGNVEYEFVIKELMDKTASPQEAFLYSREVYRTTTTASAINYTMGEPTLEGNKRYAWCVRAVMHEGIETVNRFENDGYSPVSVFDMRYDCRPPMDVQATTERGTITLRWLPQPHHLKYVVSYRRTDFDANTWYTKTTTGTSINLSDIAPGQNYTYRVGAYCDDNTPVYSASGTISVPAEDTEFLANCGKDPQIKITNRKPKDQLNVNDIIMAGDFPVTITRVSGSNGTFTGEGYVRIPYLFARFAVRFSGIGVNEENHLISGVIETKYDKTESGIANLDALDQGGTDGNIKSGITKANKTVEFALPEKFTVQYSEEMATLTFKDETGTAIGNVDIPKNPAGKPILPLTVEDKNGNVYEVHENPEKSTSSTQPYVAVKLGKQEGEIPFGSMDLNVQDEAQATITFANDASSLYALDSWQNYYSTVGIISGGNGDPNSNFDGCKYEKISANYWVKWKYIPPGKTDKVTAELLIKKEAKIDPAKVVFKTKAGKVFESTYNATTHSFTITLLGGEDKDGQELYAMHPAAQSGSWWNLGKLDIMSYAPVERKMVLVKTAANDNTDAATVQTELNRIYNPVGISWSVSMDNFEYDTQALFDKSSGILSAYNAQMRALNAAYTAAKGTIDTKTAYLFLVNQSSDKNNREVQGFMPRGMQFGYICNGCLTNQKLYSTIAHELGHGVFRLRHIFSSDYGSTAVGMKEKTQMLMDYADGINLPKWQWDQMYDPAILNGVFDSDKEAESNIPIDRAALSKAKSVILFVNGHWSKLLQGPSYGGERYWKSFNDDRSNPDYVGLFCSYFGFLKAGTCPIYVDGSSFIGADSDFKDRYLEGQKYVQSQLTLLKQGLGNKAVTVVAHSEGVAMAAGIIDELYKNNIKVQEAVYLSGDECAEDGASTNPNIPTYQIEYMYFNDFCIDQYDWVIGTNLRYKSYAGLKGVSKFGIVVDPGVSYGSVHGSTGIAIDVVDRLNDLKLAIPYQRIGKDGKIYYDYDYTKTSKRTRFYKINDTFILYKHPQFNIELNKIDTNLPCKK